MIAPHLQDYIEQYKEIRKSSDKIFAGRQLQFSLAGFTDEQLHALTIEIVANLPPEKNTHNSYRMLKELATHELISWFKAIQSTAPSFVIDQMMELTASALLKAQLNTIQEAIAVELVWFLLPM